MNTKPKYLEIGKACVELTKTPKFFIILNAFLFPFQAQKLLRLIKALQEPLANGDFGSDEELGL